MSPTPTMRRQRLHRSELAVPATSERFFAKAAASDADCIFIDLEDAVPEAQKEQARAHAIGAVNGLDWGTKTLSVRVNGLDTRWALKDIVDVATHCPRLDMILLPKAGTPFDIQFVAHILTLVEHENRRKKPIGIEALIETPSGVSHAEAIAASNERLEALIFGVGDYTIDMRTFDTILGASTERCSVLTRPDADGKRHKHWNDQWHFAMARIANACRAYGVRPIDGPYTNYGDPEGFDAAAQRAAALGFEGKWAIHPSQVARANAAFSPTAEQIAWSERILKALQHSLAKGVGAFGDEGVLVDLAHAKLARGIQERVRLIQGTSPSRTN
jgi:malyl-CoA/(S)-citramalyl-CoA lyase